jgi:putative colanic acid biosynthesis glycosyltransferase
LINNLTVKPELSSKIILSIITVAKNDIARLSKTIKSLDRIYNDERFEHIIVDCLSVDGTSDLLSKVVENTNVTVVSGRDFGIYDAMNKGSNLASGVFELYLNSGDELLALPEQIVKWCNQINPSYIDIACFPCLLQFGNESLFLRPRGYTKYRMPTSHQAMIFARNFMVNHPYNIKYRIAGDFELYLQTSTGRVCTVSSKGSLTLIQGEGFASANPLIAYREYLHIVSNRYRGTERLLGFIVIFCKGMMMIVLKKIIPKRWINYFRVIELKKFS